MLAHDATITMPPQPTWYRGRNAGETFLRALPLATGARWRLLPAAANGQIAFGEYRWDAVTERFVGRGAMVLTIADALIADITAFGNPRFLPRFGLPEQLEA